MGYTDAPDGQGCFSKILAVSKLAGICGLVVGTHDVVMITKPQGYVPTASTFLRTFIPITAAGATFAAMTCFSTSLRGTDDKLNYFFGGACGGSIFGAATKSVRVGFPCAFFASLAAVIYKDSKDSGWELFPVPKHKYGSFNGMQHDYTLLKATRD